MGIGDGIAYTCTVIAVLIAVISVCIGFGIGYLF